MREYNNKYIYKFRFKTQIQKFLIQNQIQIQVFFFEERTAFRFFVKGSRMKPNTLGVTSLNHSHGVKLATRSA